MELIPKPVAGSKKGRGGKVSETDRFSSREFIEWAKGPFLDGYEARAVHQVGLDQCPSQELIGEWAAKSWRAGWADADANIATAPPEQAAQKGGATLPGDNTRIPVPKQQSGGHRADSNQTSVIQPQGASAGPACEVIEPFDVGGPLSKVLKERLTGAWRVYDAICNLGLADCSKDQAEEIVTARKSAWERYSKLSKQLEHKP